MENYFEYIVVGSGPSGAQAAQTLVEAGVGVAMLDVGEKDEKYEQLVPNNDFEEIRRSDKEQYYYFLGEDFETIPWDEVKEGAQLTPARKAIIRNVEKYIPSKSNSFFPMESLAYGGLGAGWGLGSYEYSDNELEKVGLNPVEMKAAYQVVGDRIGISSGNDNIKKYLIGNLRNIQPALKIDNSMEKFLNSYKKKKKQLRKKNIYIGFPSMAFLTEDKGNRKKTSYQDMDFYTDREKAAYRPQFTIDELKKKPNFTYINNSLVLNFIEENDSVKVNIKRVNTNDVACIKCKNLLLAAGALGSARIVMRSFEQIKHLPILCNPYVYIPCVHLKMLGKPLSRYKTSMTQAMMIYDVSGNHDDLVSIALYTYRSLLLYKLIKEAPFDYVDSRIIMQYLQSALIIAGIHHPDEPSDKKYIELRKEKNSYTGDYLYASYSLNAEEERKIKRREKVVKSALRSLGCYPIKRVDPGYGASIHYAGTLPFCSNKDKCGTINYNGQLNGTRRVFIADGSGFKYLPAKGITFSLMANAHNVVLKVLEEK